MSSGARLLPPTLPPARGLAADGGRKSDVGNELIFELEWEPELLLESDGRCALGSPSFARPGKLRPQLSQSSGRWNSRAALRTDVRRGRYLLII